MSISHYKGKDDLAHLIGGKGGMKNKKLETLTLIHYSSFEPRNFSTAF